MSPAAALGAWGLHYTASDASLIGHLGGETRAAVPFLAYIHRLMEMSDNGPSHTDGRSNFAYVRSPIDGRLWAGAVYVPHPHMDWRASSRVLTR
jgi:hypothetical protein